MNPIITHTIQMLGGANDGLFLRIVGTLPSPLILNGESYYPLRKHPKTFIIEYKSKPLVSKKATDPKNHASYLEDTDQYLTSRLNKKTR